MDMRLKRGKAVAAGLLGAGGVGATRETALGATDIGGVAQSLSTNFAQVGASLQIIFAVAGFLLVGMGLWQLYTRSQQPGQPKGGAFMTIIIGVCLLAIVAIVKITSQTMGVDNPALSQIGVN